MPDPHRIAGELKDLLSRRQYASVLYHRNHYRNPTDPELTPAMIGDWAGWEIFNKRSLLDPVEVLELKGPVEFYRVHDGRSRVVFPAKAPGKKPTLSAGTLSAYWSERPVVEVIWKATARYHGQDRRKRFMEFMLSANFVLPEWNEATQLACMSVPPGASVVVVRGRGNWKAMQTSDRSPRPAGKAPIRTTKDVETHVGMMALPGLVQCFVPLFVDAWVHPVRPDAPHWPLST